MVYGWLYLAYTYAPHRFPEENGYLGQFLQSAGVPRFAAFTALRRMVDPGASRDPTLVSPHVFWDAYLAVTRAPRGLKADVYRFSSRYLDTWLDTAVLDDAQQSVAARLVNQGYAEVLTDPTLTSPVRAEVAASRDRLLDQLGAPAGATHGNTR